eukprot:5936081-Prymnesium_polylepis.1
MLPAPAWPTDDGSRCPPSRTTFDSTAHDQRPTGPQTTTHAPRPTHHDPHTTTHRSQPTDQNPPTKTHRPKPTDQNPPTKSHRPRPTHHNPRATTQPPSRSRSTPTLKAHAAAALATSQWAVWIVARDGPPRQFQLTYTTVRSSAELELSHGLHELQMVQREVEAGLKQRESMLAGIQRVGEVRGGCRLGPHTGEL